MDFTRLRSSYFDDQRDRLETLITKLVERKNAVAAGRVVPADGDIPIGAGRSLHAAVLFLDISSFSSRPSSTQLEQENLLRFLTIFFAQVIRVIEDYGGTVEKNTGDGMMAYFVNKGDVSAEQAAVAASLTITYCAENLVDPIMTAVGAQPFRFRICIDNGPITVANVGAPQRFGSLVAVGTAANLACKMLSFANPGDILIGETVLSRLPQRWADDYVRLRTVESGWVYASSGRPYPIYEYAGRWTVPRP
jgi:class 3 adenylate cyclase